ncbi:unnamed protein product [Trichobilharzia szidati]|nr:unnamed protein product [Trichobilharzia szidati]
MSDLKEENHKLLSKLDLLEKMESAYIDEIESLNELIACLKRKSPGEFRNIDDRQSEKLSKKNRLAEKLSAAENLEADLLKRLRARENKVDEICMDSNTGALNEVKLLENELSEMKIAAQMNTSRLCRCIEELEEDFCCVQSYKDELEQKLKVRVDKERILVEQMVVKQNEKIKELRRRLNNMPTKLASLLAVIRVDSCPYTEIMDILRAEIEDIRWENEKLHRKMKDYEELKQLTKNDSIELFYGLILRYNSSDGSVICHLDDSKKLKTSSKSSTCRGPSQADDKTSGSSG